MTNFYDLKQLNTTAGAVIVFFKNEPYKAILWFTTPNPHFGGISPMEMIERGLHNKVIKFVRTAMWENEAPK